MPKAKTADKKKKETPLMGQYNKIKAKHPDAILLFRIGDFYETFGSDAIKTAQVLGIVLTKRANGSASEMELAGFPHHALDTYLPKLVKAGYRVAICEQLEDPKATKSIVKRGVTEMITPGIATSEKIIDHKSNNYICSIQFDPKQLGIAFLDLSTGEFFTAEGQADYIDNLLQSFKPSEVLFSRRKQKDFIQKFGSKFYTYTLDEWIFEYSFGEECMLKHFGTKSLKGFGIENFSSGITAAGAILHYLKENQHPDLNHINSISRIEQKQYVWLDRFTIHNLELLDSPGGGSALIDVLDRSISPMGSRLMKKWLLMPLLNKTAIENRHAIVEYLVKDTDLRSLLQKQIKMMGDLERLISKVPMGKISPREMNQLKVALQALVPVIEACKNSDLPALQKLSDQLNPCDLLKEKIEQCLNEEAPVSLQKGNVIKSGFSDELDELRKLSGSGKEYIAALQKRESEITGIPSLKVGFNNVFGYYLEVRNTHKDKVPESWMRKQTLVNAERYITEELKEYEEKILGAEGRISVLEESIFRSLVSDVNDYVRPVQVNAQLIAQLDCLLSFATVALDNKYRRPEINDSFELKITEGRHPVIEQQLQAGEDYVPNDVMLNNNDQQIMIITGPNMSGKSALLRQTALIAIMAQIGSFVPAKAAEIGIIDKVFTRVGASDNISSGESTFMVEMNETASIMNNISERSLILLDEIGRGTSTYDGISIAWSIVEYLHNNSKAKPKTLFATHYHELNDLAAQMQRIRNFHVATKEIGQKVIFLRKLKEGGSHHSFGIHVAQMAGMPKQVIDRANEILVQLEESHATNNKDNKKQKKIKAPEAGVQMSFFQLDDPVLLEIKNEIQNLDINTLTPVEALLKLNEIKKHLGLK